MFKFIKQSVLPWSQAGTQTQAKELQPLYMGRLNLQPAKLQFSSNNMSICHKNNLKLDFFKQIARSGNLALKSLSKDLQIGARHTIQSMNGRTSPVFFLLFWVSSCIV